MVSKVLNKIKDGLVVSCQAPPDSPLSEPNYMAAMAQAAEKGGAVGIRADGPEDIAVIKNRVDLPIIGIYKRRDLSKDVYITPTLDSAKVIVEVGADILAIDGTDRPRPGELSLRKLISIIKNKLEVPVMADISTVQEGILAEKKGADILATTLSGYTPYTNHKEGPDLDLIANLSDEVSTPVIGEGRFSEPEQVLEAFNRGAHSVVIGTAITNPVEITRKFTKVLS